MITRGIIEGITENGLFKVRCPLYDSKKGSQGSTSYINLPEANYLAIPGIQVNYNIGDVVVVAFENFDYRYPIILGYLGTALNKQIPLNSILVENIKVTNSLTTNTANVKLNTSNGGDGVIDANDLISMNNDSSDINQ